MNYIINKFSHIFKFTFILFVLIYVPSNSNAASATFLKIPVGARPAALGGAFSAFKGDVNSIAYNPGALAYIEGTDVSLMRANYIGGFKHDWLSLARSHRSGVVSAIAINSLSINSIDGYANDGTPADSVSSADLAFNFAHARKISSGIGLGINLKYITERLDTERTNAFAADFGILSETSIENLNFAFVAENLGKKMKFIEDSFYLPSRMKAGLLYGRNLFNLKCLYSAEIIIPSDGKKSFRAGIEAALNKQFFFRGGWQNSRDLGSEITYGLGYALTVSKKMDMNIDYAFADYGEFGNVHRFGLTIKFAGNNRQRAEIREQKADAEEEAMPNVSPVEPAKTSDTNTEENTEEIKTEEVKPANIEESSSTEVKEEEKPIEVDKTEDKAVEKMDDAPKENNDDVAGKSDEVVKEETDKPKDD